MRALMILAFFTIAQPASAQLTYADDDAGPHRPLFGESLLLSATAAVPFVLLGHFTSVSPSTRETFGGEPVMVLMGIFGALGAAASLTSFTLDLATPRRGRHRQIVEGFLIASVGLQAFATLLPLSAAMFLVPQPADPDDRLGWGLSVLAAALLPVMTLGAASTGLGFAIDGAIRVQAAPTVSLEGAGITVVGSF